MSSPRIRVAIIGGGMSGISSAVQLQEKLGKDVEFTIYERATAPGGVWRDSQWPGAEVDLPIHMYQLFCELNPNWTATYAKRDEVLAYWNDIIDRHGFRDRFVFGANFSSSHWDPLSQSHTLTFLTSSEPFTASADIIISAAGALNAPIIPTLPGIETFKGKQWHSSRWDKSVDLRGKRVAIVGNGSTGIQVVPSIADLPGIKVTQFIRSPGYFTKKGVNVPYSPLEKLAFAWVPGYHRLYRLKLFYDLDFKTLARGTSRWSSELRETHTNNLVNYLKATAPEKYHDILVPKYPLHCKRVAYNAGWLESLHKPNVLLVGSPITAVTPSGLQTADGVEHEFDIIVWATGFDVSGTGVGNNHGVYGEEGKELAAEWDEQKGASAYLAVAVPKYPNFFIVLGPNAISMSSGYSLANQAEFIARLIAGMHKLKLSSISPKKEVTDAYNAELQERLNQTVLVSPTCTAWYRYKGDGKVIAPSGFSGTELTIKTSEIKWEDWACRRVLRAGEKAELIEVKTPTTWSPIRLVYNALARQLERYLVTLTTE